MLAIVLKCILFHSTCCWKLFNT